MKIIGIKIKDVRKISILEMKLLKKGLTPIKGKNKQGKTTVIDSIMSLFSGKKSIPSDVIQHGKKRAEISAKLEDGNDTYLIERVIKDNGQTALKVLKNGTEKVGKPETFVQSLINELTFDPRPFMDKDDQEKLQFLMKVLNLDFSDIESEYDQIYSDRRDIGRDIKSFGKPTPVPKVDPVDTKAILEEKKAIQKRNSEKEEEVREANEKTEAWNRKRVQAESRLDSLLEEEAELQKKLEAVQASIAKGRSYIKTLPATQDPVKPELESTDELDEKLANASEINQQALAYEQYTKDVEKLEQLNDSYKEKTERLSELKEAKQKRLAETPMPVEGLSIRLEGDDKDGVYFNETHSANWSESESMRISSELCLKLQPGLRAIFIDRGEAYDSSSLKELGKWAEDNNIQALITIVSDIPETLEDGVFYIEDGDLLSNR